LRGLAWRLLLPACGEKVGMRGHRRRRGRQDCLPNALDVSQYVVVPEPQDTKATLDQPSVADGVASALGVLAAIDLDDKALLSTDKIDDVRSNRFLANEFEPAQRP